jgi:hypothetical protein
MRVLWRTNRDASKVGTLEKIPTTVAEVAIYNGEAVAAPYRNHIERLNEESSKTRKLQPGDVAVPNVEGTRWGLQEHPLAGWIILRESGSEQVRFSDPEYARYHGCPERLCKELASILGKKQDQAEKTAQETKSNFWR